MVSKETHSFALKIAVQLSLHDGVVELMDCLVVLFDGWQLSSMGLA